MTMALTANRKLHRSAPLSSEGFADPYWEWREDDMDVYLGTTRVLQLLRIKRQNAVIQKMRKTLLGFDTTADEANLNVIELDLDDFTDHPHRRRIPLPKDVETQKLAAAISNEASQKILETARERAQWRVEEVNWQKTRDERRQREEISKYLLRTDLWHLRVFPQPNPETCRHFYY
jgi:hypothetical protein